LATLGMRSKWYNQTMEVTCNICTTERRFSLSTTPVGVHVTQIRTPRPVMQSGRDLRQNGGYLKSVCEKPYGH
jgi:hypothetical protein